jgi:hypothetical protein
MLRRWKNHLTLKNNKDVFFLHDSVQVLANNITEDSKLNSYTKKLLWFRLENILQ